MKQTRLLSEFSCLSEYTRLYPRTDSTGTAAVVVSFEIGEKSPRVLIVLKHVYVPKG